MKSRDMDSTILLTDYAKWLAERFERMNEAISHRASTFLGFLGVELTLLGQISVTDHPNDRLALAMTVLACALLIASIYFLLETLSTKDFDLPEWSDIQSVREEKIENISKFPLDVLMHQRGNQAYFQSLDEENSTLAKNYSLALKLAFIAQIVVGLLIISRWMA